MCTAQVHCVRPRRSAQEEILISMKTKTFCSLLLFVTANGIAATNDPASALPALLLTPASVNQLAEEMRANHPALLAARVRTNAAAAGVSAVRTWDDPIFRIGAMAADTTMRADNGDLIYAAEQKLPLFGKARASRAVASAELAVEIASEDYQFQTLRRDLAKALFRAALADETLAIAAQDLEWLNIATKVAEENYRAGTVRLMDVLTLQNEQSKRSEQLITERENRSQAVLALNLSLGRDHSAPWPTIQLPPLADELIYSDRLVRLALRNEPKLKVMRQQIQQGEASVNLSRKQRWPDVTLGVENRNYSRNGELRQTEVMLGFSFPFGNAARYRADIRREESKRAAAEFDVKDYERSVLEEVHALTVKISAARREALLYREKIIPRSEQALASAKAMYESGGALRDVLDARRMLLEGKLMFARAIAEQYEMLSELVLCCGLGDLESLQMLSAQNREPKP